MISRRYRATLPNERPVPLRQWWRRGYRGANRAVSSAVEHWFYTPLVGSSILSPPTSLRPAGFALARQSSLACRELRRGMPADFHSLGLSTCDDESQT